jgi:hypothetical protein
MIAKAVSFVAKSGAGKTTLICRGEENDPSLIAVASDEPLDLDVPVLDLNNPVQVADFVEKHIIHAAH